MISPDNHAKGLVCIMSCLPYIGAGGLGCHKGGVSKARQGREAGDAGENVFGSREHLSSDSCRASFSVCIVRPPSPAHNQQGGARWRRSTSRNQPISPGIKSRVRLRGGGKQSCRVCVNEQRGLWEGCQMAGALRMRTLRLLGPNAVARTRIQPFRTSHIGNQ